MREQFKFLKSIWEIKLKDKNDVNVTLEVYEENETEAKKSVKQYSKDNTLQVKKKDPRSDIKGI